MSIRKSPHKRQRKKDDKGGSGLQWGSRTPQEVEMMGQTKPTDVVGIGPVATQNLQKAGIDKLSEVDEFKDAKTGDILQKETKLTGRQVQKLVSARERARDVEVLKIRESHNKDKSRRKKKLKTLKTKKKEQRASSMKHFIKDYAYRRFKEHNVAAPSDEWDTLKDEIDWHGPVSSAWDIAKAWLIKHGYQTDEELESTAEYRESISEDLDRQGIVEHYEREVDHLEDQSDKIMEEIEKESKIDPEITKPILAKTGFERKQEQMKIRRLKFQIDNQILHVKKTKEVGTDIDQKIAKEQLTKLISKQHRLTGERMEAGKLPDLPGHIEETKPKRKKRPAETLDIYNPKQKRFSNPKSKSQPNKQIRIAYDQIRADEPAFTGLIPLNKLKKSIQQTDSTMTDKQINESLLAMERKRIVDLQIAYDPTKAVGKEYGIKTERGLIMYVRYR